MHDPHVRLDWPASAMRLQAFRLLPGEDLRTGIEGAFAAAPEQAGFVASAVGSLSRLVIRPAGRDTSLAIERDLEIIALSGTLSADGPHLHVAVADEAGAMTGGHLLGGSIVRSTAELVIALVAGARFERALDPQTGFRELAFRRI